MGGSEIASFVERRELISWIWARSASYCLSKWYLANRVKLQYLEKNSYLGLSISMKHNSNLTHSHQGW